MTFHSTTNGLLPWKGCLFSGKWKFVCFFGGHQVVLVEDFSMLL